MRMTSGVSTMSREIVMGTLDKFDWVQLGAAIKHPEFGKVIDVNDDVRKRTGIEDANVKIYAYNGYGDMQILRRLIKIEKPDAILHFTDPHYWQWLYDAEHEIRQDIPILYYHVWDNLPDPTYNRNYYESCDWIGCISKQTYGLVKRVVNKTEYATQSKLQDWQISYVPHGINEKIFRPLDVDDQELREKICGKKEYDFILFYNNRNIRRKQPSDVIHAYSLFCDMLPKEKSAKCLLLMHTSPVDNNGTNLNAVAKTICPDYDIKFTNMKVEQDVLNKIYNISDCTINIANNEGFGLGTVESIMAGTPIIVNVTGGLQDQCGFKFSEEDYVKLGSLHNKKIYGSTPHGEWALPVWSSAINLNGSPATPYIFDDRVNDEEVAEKIKKMYDMGREKRKEVGKKGREWAIKNMSAKIMCDKLSEGIETTLKMFTPRKKYELFKIS